MAKFWKKLGKAAKKAVPYALGVVPGMLINNVSKKYENSRKREGEAKRELEANLEQQQEAVSARGEEQADAKARLEGLFGQSPQFQYNAGRYDPTQIGIPEYEQFQPQYDPMDVGLPEYGFQTSYDPLGVDLPESTAYTPVYDPMSVQAPEYQFETDIDPMSVAMPGQFEYEPGVDPMQAELSPEAQEAISRARTRAGRTEMPGQSLMEAKLARQGAGAMQTVRDMGGGIAGLGAVSSIYGQQQEAMTDLALQAAQYRDTTEQQLQGTLFQGSQERRAQQQMLMQEESRRFGQARDIYQTQLGASQAERASQQTQLGLESDIYGRQYQAQSTEAQRQREMMMQQNVFGADLAQQQYQNQFAAAQSQRQAMQQAQTFEAQQAQQSYANQFAASESQRQAMQQQNVFGAQQAQQTWQNQFATSQAQRETMAQQQQFDYNVAQQQFQYNQMMPYQQQLGYYQGEVARTDPFAAQMGLYGDQAGLAVQAQQQEMMNRQNMTNTLMQLLGIGVKGATSLMTGGIGGMGGSK